MHQVTPLDLTPALNRIGVKLNQIVRTNGWKAQAKQGLLSREEVKQTLDEECIFANWIFEDVCEYLNI